MRQLRVCSVAFVLCLVAVAPARPDDFYKDKTVTIVISTGAGGNDDLITKGLTRYMPAPCPATPT